MTADSSVPAGGGGRDPLAAIRRNRRIKAPRVRVISREGRQLGVFATSQAIELALGAGFDLVELAPNAVPPVCRIMDFGKFVSGGWNGDGPGPFPAK